MSITNENEEEVVLEDLPEIEDGEEDTTDWKALAIKNQGIAKRLKTKMEKAKTETKVVEQPKSKDEPKAGELDRIDRAVLRTEKITAPEEIELVQSLMKETGKDLEGVLASRFFQSELKDLREQKSTEDATPSGSKRSGQSTRDSVDYWIAKGELPSDPALRIKVVNAKIAKAKSTNMFSDTPIM